MFCAWSVHDLSLHLLLCPTCTVLMKIPPSQFKLLMDSIVWAFKHTMRNVAEIGLNILLTLLQKFSRDQMGTQFFQTYFIDLMQHIFSVVTDSSHSASKCLLPLHAATPLLACTTLHVYIHACMAMQYVWTQSLFVMHVRTWDMLTCFDLQSTTSHILCTEL